MRRTAARIAAPPPMCSSSCTSTGNVEQHRERERDTYASDPRLGSGSEERPKDTVISTAMINQVGET